MSSEVFTFLIKLLSTINSEWGISRNILCKGFPFQLFNELSSNFGLIRESKGCKKSPSVGIITSSFLDIEFSKLENTSGVIQGTSTVASWIVSCSKQNGSFRFSIIAHT